MTEPSDTAPEPTAAAVAPTAAELLANDRAVLDFASEDEETEEGDDEEGEEVDEERPAKRQRQDPPAKDTSRQIEIPRKATFTRADKINNSIMRVTGNSVDGGFSMFNTSSSIPMMTVYKKEIAAARKLLTAKKPQEAFCIAMATYLSMQDYDVWYHDTEDHRGVETLFTSFYKLWNDIFKSDDDTIGLKGRDVLIGELSKFGKRAKDDHNYDFPWFA
ncbi:hypothetical protein DYB32_005460 [Aphanomyces invadans]|uniref:Uncharacterized protein n=1 Tax=Aphanomyces invadans TaxID=157072 RepID=A0A3R6Z3B9_9STRA|nr:hypothetical protein DYB32_005460 [Aphanomyces invadans]